MSNGIKYNKNEIKHIKIRYDQNDNFHIFQIEDNGIGIPTQYHQQIFKMFKRLNNRGLYEGSGLGLSIVKKMLQNLAGNVLLLSSKENKGSIFQVSIPLVSIKPKEQIYLNIAEQN